MSEGENLPIPFVETLSVSDFISKRLESDLDVFHFVDKGRVFTKRVGNIRWKSLVDELKNHSRWDEGYRAVYHKMEKHKKFVGNLQLIRYGRESASSAVGDLQSKPIIDRIRGYEIFLEGLETASLTPIEKGFVRTILKAYQRDSNTFYDSVMNKAA